MKITEALKILQSTPKTNPAFPVALACGFTPLHLSTFLAAHMQQRLPGKRVETSTGLYGDLPGTLESLQNSAANAIAIVLEWSDLDPRLGFRSAGRWGLAAIADILAQAPRTLHRIAGALEALPRGIAIALAAPTLPLPPLFHTAGPQASAAELELDAMLAEFLSTVQRRTPIHIVNARRLAEDSAPAQRFDLKADLLTGLPYTTTHAGTLACALSNLLLPAAPKKGLITDLDDTLWSGLVGEVGPNGVTWDLASHKALHGLYQRLLAAFAEEGVLVGIASKNDAAVVEQAFEREDILLPASAVFPMEVHWNAKSGSIARILERWNIAADSVVFVDDSPMELAEVAAVHPGIECVQFPGKDNPASGYEMLRRLRNLFGKPRLSEEDALRSSSIRRAADFAAAANGNQNASEDFLRNLNASVSFQFPEAITDHRALELVNKTNQFNLNGIRYTEAEWSRRTSASDSVCAVIGYEDKFGPLGKISVLQGHLHGRTLHVDVWVLSCRAFARRIEYQTLRTLFDRFDHLESIEFAFTPTAKNSTIAEFLKKIGGPTLTLTRQDFHQLCPPLYHTVKESTKVEVQS